MYKEIYDKIKSLLETITDIKQVSIFNNGIFDAYPAINITNLTKTRVSTTHCTIEEDGQIILNLYQEINADNKGAYDGEIVVLNLMDNIDDIFDKNPTLDGLVDDITLTNAETGFAEGQVNMRVYRFTLSYKLLKQII